MHVDTAPKSNGPDPVGDRPADGGPVRGTDAGASAPCPLDASGAMLDVESFLNACASAPVPAPSGGDPGAAMGDARADERAPAQAGMDDTVAMSASVPSTPVPPPTGETLADLESRDGHERHENAVSTDRAGERSDATLAEKDGGSPPERFPDETRPAAIGNELKSNGAVERDADAAVDATVAAMPAQRDAGDVPTAIDAESPGRLVREDESDENNIWRTPDEPVEQAPVGQGPHETASREGEVESTDGDEGSLSSSPSLATSDAGDPGERDAGAEAAEADAAWSDLDAATAGGAEVMAIAGTSASRGEVTSVASTTSSQATGVGHVVETAAAATRSPVVAPPLHDDTGATLDEHDAKLSDRSGAVRATDIGASRVTREPDAGTPSSALRQAAQRLLDQAVELTAAPVRAVPAPWRTLVDVAALSLLLWAPIVWWMAIQPPAVPPVHVPAAATVAPRPDENDPPVTTRADGERDEDESATNGPDLGQANERRAEPSIT